MNACPKHGPHRGHQFVDGIDLTTGRRFGRSETYCQECREAEIRAQFPHRDDPVVKQLREDRKALNLTQRELGALMGLHPAEISKIEQGIAPPDGHEVRDYRAALVAAAKR